MGAPALLVGDAVHVFVVGLAAGPDAAEAREDERERADRLWDRDAASRFLASRAWLRVILACYLEVEAGAIRFEVTYGGKPSIVGYGDLGFSLSRSSGLALIALTRGRAVGVDIERVDPTVDHDRLAERFFSPGEADHLRSLADPDRRAAFFRLWVAKEAVVKASGAGLGDGLSHVETGQGTVDGRSVAPLAVAPGYAAAVAVDGVLGPCTTWTLPGGEPLVRG